MKIQLAIWHIHVRLFRLHFCIFLFHLLILLIFIFVYLFIHSCIYLFIYLFFHWQVIDLAFDVCESIHWSMRSMTQALMTLYFASIVADDVALDVSHGMNNNSKSVKMIFLKMACSNVSIDIVDSPIRQTIAGLSSFWSLWIKVSEIFIKTQNFLFTKIHLKISSVKWRPFCRREIT